MGGWTLLDLMVRGKQNQNQNPESCRTRVFIPNEVGMATQRVPRHMREHKLTRYVHRAEYKNTQCRARESCE